MTPGAGQSDLHVIIENRQSLSGQAYLALFTNSDDWMKMERAYRQASQSCSKEDGSIFITLTDLPHGTYAACVLLDINGNRQMDFNIIGYPTEPFAFSTQSSTTTIIGPPEFDQASFSHDGEMRLYLQL